MKTGDEGDDGASGGVDFELPGRAVLGLSRETSEISSVSC